MRTTLDIDDALLAQAPWITGVHQKPQLIHRGLRSLVHREAARRLAALGGTMSGLNESPHRRPTGIR